MAATSGDLFGLDLTVPREDSMLQSLKTNEIEFSLRGIQMRKLDTFSESDPYFVITDMDSKKELFKSSVEDDNPNPRFISRWRRPPLTDEEFQKSIKIEVFDKDPHSDDFIGDLQLTYAQLLENIQGQTRMDLQNPKTSGYNGGLYVYVDPVFTMHSVPMKVNVAVENAAKKKMFYRLLRGSLFSYATPVYISQGGKKENTIEFPVYETTFTDFLCGDYGKKFVIELYEGPGWCVSKHKLLGSAKSSLRAVVSDGPISPLTWETEHDSGDAKCTLKTDVTASPAAITLSFTIELPSK
mmetsp:Transcript_11984/g.21702  ORF Transcript_11984/g.21702 Transcript_11984/m.21702 type:complete len:297 (-) Transcript_11984:127-1017(-)